MCVCVCVCVLYGAVLCGGGGGGGGKNDMLWLPLRDVMPPPSHLERPEILVLRVSARMCVFAYVL